jgi:hypothetical protein
MAHTFKLYADTDIGPSGTPQELVVGVAVASIVQSATFCNIGASESFCNVSVTDTSGGVTARVAFKTSIPAGQTLTLDKVIVLENTDTLDADGTNIESVISVLEIT